MKRSMLFVCAAMLTFAVACKKDDKKKADDKADTKPADPSATAGTPGDTKPAEGTPAAGTEATGAAPDVSGICKKLEELATKEGGEALEMYNSRLKDDCVKDLGEEAAKKGEATTKEFAACIDKATSFTNAMDTCKQF